MSNEGPERMREFIGAYRSIGLAQEGAALEAVAAAALLARDRDTFSETLGAAYASVPNDMPEFEDRLRFILGWVRSNPHLFAE